MHRSTLLFIAILAVLASALGYNYFFQPFAYLDDDQTEVQTPQDTRSQAEIQAQAIANLSESMSTEEKIAQLFMVPVQIKPGSIPTQQTSVKIATGSAKQATSSAATLSLPTSNAASSDSSSLQSVVKNSTTASQLADQTQLDEYGIVSTTYEWMSQFKPGGITIFGSKLGFLDTQEVILKLQRTQQVVTETNQDAEQDSRQATNQQNNALIVAVDHEGGSVQRLSGSGFTILPSWQEQCAQPIADTQLLWEKSAKELKEVGVTVVFSPMVDFALNHPVLKDRICSDNTQKVITYAQAYYENFQDVGVQPVFKHFPGIGQTKVDLHSKFESVTIGTEEAFVYQSLADTLAPRTLAVMSSHVGVTNQFAKVPCSQSESCVNEIFAIAPDAFVFSDALEMESALEVNNSMPEAARLAIQAGNSFLVFGAGVTPQEITEIHSYLVTQYTENELFRAKVDVAIQKVLQFKQLQAK